MNHLNWIVAQTAHIFRLGSGLQLDCAHAQISLLSDEVSRSVDIGIEERKQPKEDIGVVRVLFIAHRGYFTNNHIIIILFYLNVQFL